MKRRILYVITKSNWGGAQRYVFDLASNLPKDGFEVIVASCGGGELIEKLRNAGIRTADIPAFQRDIDMFKEFKALWQLFRLFLREKPDVIHLNSSKAGGIGALSAFIYKVICHLSGVRCPKVVFTAHGWGFNEPRPEWQKFLIKTATRLAALFQDKIITICDVDLTSAREFIPSKKLALIPNGINVPEFLPQNSARNLLEKKIGKNFQPDAFVIGTIAELTRNKGLDYLIDAVSAETAERKLQTLIIGDGEDLEKLREKINSGGLSNSVFLTRSIPDAARLLKAFDIFVLPSLKEGLPYTLLEAMAAGIPSVASSVGGIPNIIKNRETGLLVPPANASELKNAILELRNDKALAERLGQNASWTIKTKFTLTAMIEKTQKIYAQ